MYQSLSLKITGVCPLLMHNAQLADPLNRFSREIAKISGKRGKTEADHEEIAKLEYLGGLYLHKGAPCIPGEMLEATLINAAMKKRRGNQAKAGLLCDGMYPLEYDGPKDALGLWADERFRLRSAVRVQRARVMRTRPMFPDWSVDIEVQFMPSLLNKSEVRDIIALGGEIAGLGDWRPRFGRYTL